MAEANEGQNTVDLTTKFGGLRLAGKDALDLFLFLSIIALGGLTIYEHIQRSTEHELISCQIKLNLFMQQQDFSKAINWRAMPTDLYNCVPKFIYDRDEKMR